MKTLLAFVLALGLAPTASAWDYVPIEQSRSYNAYRGPYAYPAYGYGYYQPVRVYVSRDPLDPLGPPIAPRIRLGRGYYGGW